MVFSHSQVLVVRCGLCQSVWLGSRWCGRQSGHCRVIIRAGGVPFGCCAGCSGCGCGGQGCGAGRVDGVVLGRAGGRGVDGGRDALQQRDQDRVGGVLGRGAVVFVHAEADLVVVGVVPIQVIGL